MLMNAVQLEGRGEESCTILSTREREWGSESESEWESECVWERDREFLSICESIRFRRGDELFHDSFSQMQDKPLVRPPARRYHGCKVTIALLKINICSTQAWSWVAAPHTLKAREVERALKTVWLQKAAHPEEKFWYFQHSRLKTAYKVTQFCYLL